VLDSLIPLVAAMAHLPFVTISADEVTTVAHGGWLGRPGIAIEGPVAMVDPEGELIAVGRFEGDRLRPSKVFR
jgi:tRNA U55 pseudouridine synthase TruB